MGEGISIISSPFRLKSSKWKGETFYADEEAPRDPCGCPAVHESRTRVRSVAECEWLPQQQWSQRRWRVVTPSRLGRDDTKPTPGSDWPGVGFSFI